MGVADIRDKIVGTEEEGNEDVIVGDGKDAMNLNEGVGAASDPRGAGVDDSFHEIEEDESLFQGAHETLVLESKKGENTPPPSPITAESCKKYPGHKEYIPVQDFNINHLPVGQRVPHIVEFIKATADLTVKVEVEETSKERPEKWPNTFEYYPFHEQEYQEGEFIRCGTGMVCYVKKWKEGNFQNGKVDPCKCQKCQISDTPSKEWGEIMIFTATHVVFDDFEARHTSCQLFYDSEDCTPTTLYGWKILHANIYTDRCLLVCVTCDLATLNKLVIMRKTWRDSRLQKYTVDQPLGFDNSMIFIVSHPDGLSKQVSIGFWKPHERKCKSCKNQLTFCEGTRTKFTYTTPTCPGSSGAYVHPMMYDPTLIYYHHVHSGVNQLGYNFSGFGR